MIVNILAGIGLATIILISIWMIVAFIPKKYDEKLGLKVLWWR